MSSPSLSSRSWKSERARVGALARCVKTGQRSPNDPDLIEAAKTGGDIGQNVGDVKPVISATER